MDYNVANLLKSPVGATRTYEIEPTTLRLDETLGARITGGQVRLDRTNAGILARGHADAMVSLICARCLGAASATIGADFAEEYVPSVDIPSGRPLPPPDDELTFQIDAHHVLSVSEALRQTILAALPIQPLCRPDCAGLCPTCGTNRNAAPCTCAPVDENHPLAALADLVRPE